MQNLILQSEILDELIKSMTYLDLIEYIDFNSMNEALEYDKDSLIKIAKEISLNNS
jgi:hypothetical protein